MDTTSTRDEHWGLELALASTTGYEARAREMEAALAAAAGRCMGGVAPEHAQVGNHGSAHRVAT